MWFPGTTTSAGIHQILVEIQQQQGKVMETLDRIQQQQGVMQQQIGVMQQQIGDVQQQQQVGMQQQLIALENGTARCSNASATVTAHTIQPLRNVHGILPAQAQPHAIWFPDTCGMLSNATNAQLTDLIDFYALIVPADGGPLAQRRKFAIRTHLGIRT